jgi:hypothetical protein
MLARNHATTLQTLPQGPAVGSALVSPSVFWSIGPASAADTARASSGLPAVRPLGRLLSW